MAHGGVTSTRTATRGVEVWLWIVALLIAAMVIVGGATRLTGSGLSITEWRPVTGAIPPLNEADWLHEFSLYQQSPQYQLENSHFTVSEFRAIFWWEWAHRLIGRLMGVLFFVPMLVFWLRGQLQGHLKTRALILLALGLWQGVLGWLMVASGLVDQPHVSHFRLAAHLLTAFFTLCVVAWTVLEVRSGRRWAWRTAQGRLALSALIYVFVQCAWGAFAAGLKAGYYYPTWPRMGEGLIPPSVAEDGLLDNLVNNPVGVQFFHRWFAVAVVIVALVAAISLAKADRRNRSAAIVLALAALGQFVLGVVTILNFFKDPVLLGMSHQAGALVLMLTVVVAAYVGSREEVSDSLEHPLA